MPANQPDTIAHWESQREDAITQCLKIAEGLKSAGPQHYVTGYALSRLLLGCRVAMSNHTRNPCLFIPGPPGGRAGETEVAHMLFASFASRSAVESALVILNGRSGSMKPAEGQKAWLDQRWAHARLLELCFSGVRPGMDKRDVTWTSALYIQNVGFPLEEKVRKEMRQRIDEAHSQMAKLHKGVRNDLLKEGIAESAMHYNEFMSCYKALEEGLHAIETGKEQCEDWVRNRRLARFATYTKFLYIISEGLLEQVAIIKAGPKVPTPVALLRWVDLRADYLKHVIVYLKAARGIPSRLRDIQETDSGLGAPNDVKKGQDSSRCCIVV